MIIFYAFEWNDNIVDIEKADGLCSLTFIVDGFLGCFYTHQCFLLKIQNLNK